LQRHCEIPPGRAATSTSERGRPDRPRRAPRTRPSRTAFASTRGADSDPSPDSPARRWSRPGSTSAGPWTSGSDPSAVSEAEAHERAPLHPPRLRSRRGIREGRAAAEAHVHPAGEGVGGRPFHLPEPVAQLRPAGEPARSRPAQLEGEIAQRNEREAQAPFDARVRPAPERIDGRVDRYPRGADYLAPEDQLAVGDPGRRGGAQRRNRDDAADLVSREGSSGPERSCGGGGEAVIEPEAGGERAGRARADRLTRGSGREPDRIVAVEDPAEPRGPGRGVLQRQRPARLRVGSAAGPVRPVDAEDD